MTPKKRKPRKIVVWAVVDAKGRKVESFIIKPDAQHWRLSTLGERVVRCEGVLE